MCPATGHGVDWPGGNPPAYYHTDLARTYAPRVVGSYISMQFNSTTSAFELEYIVGSISTDIPTEIFVMPSRYPGGAVVSATATVGSVNVVYDGKSQWVKIFASSGLQVGAHVTIKISKKP